MHNMTKRKIKPYKRFSVEEDQFLRDNFLEMNYHELSRKMGRSKYGIVNRLKRLGIKVPKEIMDKRKRESQFNKGHVPANKVKKGFCAAGCEKTWFKKGHKPVNTKFDGAITIRHDHHNRSGRPYKWIRIAESKWLPLHQYLWIQNYGSIPEKHVVIFKDGNSMNCVIENLELITMAENARRNHNAKKAAVSRMKNPLTIAKYIAKGNKKLAEQLVKDFPELIELKRKQLELRREVLNVQNKT